MNIFPLEMHSQPCCPLPSAHRMIQRVDTEHLKNGSPKQSSAYDPEMCTCLSLYVCVYIMLLF